LESFQALIDWLAENESAFSAVAAIAVIAGVVYGALRFILAPILRGKSKNPASNKNTTSDAAESSQKKSLGDRHDSIAVLLFEALSENKDDEFLASGITSEVIAHVTQVPHIRVSSRLSSFTFKSGRDDIKVVAEQLNAQFILTGSLRRAGDRILVIAQLTDTVSDSEIWAQTYDREIEDLFEVQHDISKCIVGAVLGEVKLADTNFAGATPDHQLDAWGLVQKAYHFWLTSFTPEGLLSAIEYLRQALDIDPKYPTARAALAMLISQTLTTRISADYDASFIEAKSLIDTAYQQAPNDIDVLENAGVVWLNTGEQQRANMALRRLVQLSPLNLIGRGYLALLTAMTQGKAGAQEALALIEENFATAPKHPSAPYWHFFQSVAEQGLGNHQSAIDYANRALLGQPGWVHAYFVIANSYGELDDRDGAVSAIANAIKINPYLTAELYADNINRMCADEDQAQAFRGGLKRLELI
jgi:TolB-like protein/Tfp pilus assembly protein PilF